MSIENEIPTLRAALLAWYDSQGRSLPWRIRPDARRAGQLADPYAIWLSEIMLQQTTVPHATPYWHRFLELWPTVEALAGASRDDVMREWAGLGYYARARNLHACARIVSTELSGRFPDTLAALQALPGIGDYTSNAILAAAFDKPASVVDGNVERVITRFYRVMTQLPRAKSEIRKLALGLADPDRSGDYAQAIMDLGATVCTPKSPNCGSCPWMDRCRAYRKGDVLSFPRKASKKSRPVRRGIAWVVRRKDETWLRRRADSGLLGGMMEVPSTEWIEAEPVFTPPFSADWADHGEIKHVFTHFELRLSVREAEAEDGWTPESGQWASLEEMPNQALPSVMRKVIDRAS
jgi:A/G-specific adenine glycosylase